MLELEEGTKIQSLYLDENHLFDIALKEYEYQKQEELEMEKRIAENIMNAKNKSGIPDKLKAYLSTGRLGITNAQMIPAIKKAIDNNDLSVIDELKLLTPAIYESSLKYIGKKYTKKLLAM